jgi:hypothetical protein
MSTEFSEKFEDFITMCNICLRNPCHSRCPNAEEPRSVFICSGCGQTIYEGDEYVELMGEQWCESCVDNATHIAEYEGDDI